MRVLIMGAAVASALITPAFADYYIVQQPETRRCTIVEERPASPSVGVVIGGLGSQFALRRKADCGLWKNVELEPRAVAVKQLLRNGAFARPINKGGSNPSG